MTNRLENGTSQGSVVSSMLFSLMINDLSKKITAPAALYADDLCFWECGSDVTLLNQLCQLSFSKVCNWCDVCGFKIFGTNSAVLFKWKNNPTPISLLLQNSIQLHMRNEDKYLRITFQRNAILYLLVAYTESCREMPGSPQCYSVVERHVLGRR